MAKISTWSTTAANNNSAAPDGFPEGMAPSGLNDGLREVMAQVRAQWQQSDFFDWGDTPTRGGDATFTVSGDVTARYTVNRIIKTTGTADSWHRITSSSYGAPNTTVIVTGDTLPATLTTVELGVLDPTNVLALTVTDTSGADYMVTSHDGTDVNTVATNTTDWNISGLTAIQAGAVDLDVDALTATSYGGITEANLVDKSATETISGAWTFSSSSSVIGGVTASNLLDKSAVETVSGAYTFTGGVTFSTGNITAGTIDADFDAVTATSYGGITEANLVDKSAVETISGAWTLSNASITGGSVTGITDLDVADGGTGASTAANARTNLGVAIGSDVQAYDADLAAIAALAKTDGNFIVGNGSAWVAESGATARASLGVDASGTDNSTDVTLAGTPDYITISGQIITRNQIDLTTDVTGDLPVADGGTGSSTAAGARTNLGVAIGSDVQAYDADLAAIAALSSADGNFIVGSAGGWVAESGATARASLGVDAAGTDNSTNVTLAGTPDYITISGQQITRNQIVLTTDVSGTLPVANGGTGATTLTGLLSGNGTGAITGGATVNNSNWSGTDLSVANGGTGASTLTGLLQGNGTGAITGGATVNNSNWSGTDLAVANGGTGASDAATARSNLGLFDEQLLYVASDQSISNDTTMGDITGLVSSALDANTFYAFSCYIRASAASGTPDIYYQLNFTQALQDSYGQMESFRGTTENYQSGGALTKQHTIFPDGGANDESIRFTGYFHTNASTGGTFSMQWRQITDSADSITTHAGSWIRITKMGT